MRFARSCAATWLLLARSVTGSIIRNNESAQSAALPATAPLALVTGGQKTRMIRNWNTDAQQVSVDASAVRSIHILVGKIQFAKKNPTVINITFGHGERVEWARTYEASADGKTKIRFEKRTRGTGEILSEMVGMIVVSSVAALVFQRYLKAWPPVEENPDPSVLKEWSSGLCSCAADMQSCFFACCCLSVQWADNAERIGFQPFWNAFAVLTLLESLAVWDANTWLFVIVMVTYLRQEIRKRFGMEGTNCSSICGDGLLSCCCMCCVVAQEARHLIAAAKNGHDAVAAVRPVLGDAISVAAEATPQTQLSENREPAEAVTNQDEPADVVTNQDESQPTQQAAAAQSNQ